MLCTFSKACMVPFTSSLLRVFLFPFFIDQESHTLEAYANKKMYLDLCSYNNKKVRGTVQADKLQELGNPDQFNWWNT
jgi:hypothetical protein